MAISKIKKTSILNDLQVNVNDQKSVVLVSTNSTEKTVDAATNFDLRSKANQAGVKVKVIKNSLIEKNFEGVKDLSGQTYIAYLNDQTLSNEVAVPKIFIKLIDTDFKDNFKVVGAIINGEFVDAIEAVKYSNIPSKDESLAMIAGAVNQIASGVARAVKAVADQKAE
jgi:large subunit ribosomal protein L10